MPTATITVTDRIKASKKKKKTAQGTPTNLKSARQGASRRFPTASRALPKASLAPKDVSPPQIAMTECWYEGDSEAYTQLVDTVNKYQNTLMLHQASIIRRHRTGEVQDAFGDIHRALMGIQILRNILFISEWGQVAGEGNVEGLLEKSRSGAYREFALLGLKSKHFKRGRAKLADLINASAVIQKALSVFAEEVQAADLKLE